jgi:hypothetical protein
MSKLNLASTQLHFLTEPVYALNRYFVENNINIPLIRSCILFHRPANFPQPLHLDCNNDNPPQLINCGINIPITNCDDSYMEWYTGDYATSVNAVTGNDGVVRKFIELDWKEHPTLIDKVIIDVPTLVKVNVPHKVTVIDRTRSLITLRFQDNPAFDDISKLIV